jgi:uncharacterized protein YcaQ
VVRREDARRLAVVRQHLSGPRPAPVTSGAIHDLVRDIGCLQLDPTAIVAPNHLLVACSRLGPYDPALVGSLLWDERLLYEHWAHQASIVPTEDRALHTALPLLLAQTRTTVAWLTQRATAVDIVLERLATTGTVRAADFEEHATKYASGWGDRSAIGDSLVLLWLQGQIVPAGRDGRGRRWALAHRWFGGPPGPILDQDSAVRVAATRSLRMLGVATEQQVSLHVLRGRYPGLSDAWQRLEADGSIVPVDIGVKGAWYVHAQDIDQLDRIEAGEFEPRTTFLSPFDNLICDRKRTLALWDFFFRLEIYVPKAKRWGYFVMPLLHGDELIARFDLAVDRAAGRLQVLGERWEPGWEGRKKPLRAVQRALRDLEKLVLWQRRPSRKDQNRAQRIQA